MLMVLIFTDVESW